MIETELICSREYAKKVNPQLAEDDWSKIIIAGRKLNPAYKQNIPYFLEQIPFYTGFDWSEENSYIPIYLANLTGPSRTNPITIKIGSVENMLVKIIHELTHLNFPNTYYNLEGEIYEDLINQVTLKVSNDKSIKDCDALEKILTFRRFLLDKGLVLEEIPLGGINIRDYFIKNTSTPSNK